MGSIERRPGARGGSWRVRWRDSNHASRSKGGFRTKKEAEAFLISTEHSVITGTYVDPRGGRVTVAEYGAAWLLSRKAHLRPSTARPEDSAWRNHVLPKWGSKQLAKILHSDVQAWVADLVARGYSATTVKRAHGILLAILESAVRDRRLSSNPAAGVRQPKKQSKRRAYLSATQVDALAEASKHPSIVLLLAYTGLRWGEVTAIRVRNIDVEKRRIRIDENAVDVAGTIHVGQPKTSQGRRTITYPAFLGLHIGELMEGRNPGDLLIGNGETHMVRSNSTRGWFRAAVERCQTEDPTFPFLTPHDLRHTAASLAISAGANVKALQRMLGHASAAMTLDTYADLFEDDLDNVATALDRLRRESNP